MAQENSFRWFFYESTWLSDVFYSNILDLLCYSSLCL